MVVVAGIISFEKSTLMSGEMSIIFYKKHNSLITRLDYPDFCVFFFPPGQG